MRFSQVHLLPADNQAIALFFADGQDLHGAIVLIKVI
jgi:hypothetical protein